MQPLFAVFEQPAAVFQSIQSFVLISVFVFKVYYRFTIMKDNTLVYSSDHGSDTQEECGAQVKEVREAMKQRESYNPHEQSGTHWVEVNANQVARMFSWMGHCHATHAAYLLSKQSLSASLAS